MTNGQTALLHAFPCKMEAVHEWILEHKANMFAVAEKWQHAFDGGPTFLSLSDIAT